MQDEKECHYAPSHPALYRDSRRNYRNPVFRIARRDMRTRSFHPGDPTDTNGTTDR